MKNLKSKPFNDLKQESIYFVTQECLYKRYLTKSLRLCCSPHKGCNKIGRKPITVWKKYRKTQYKIKMTMNLKHKKQKHRRCVLTSS